jgi:AraC-like DNA-binding protein
VEEARDAVTRIYLPHDLSAEGPRLAMRLNAAPQKRFTLGFLAYGARTELQMPATETTYHINLTTRGETFAEREDGQRAVTRADASGVVLLPDQLNVVRWTEDAEQLILKIPRIRLESHLADLIGRPVDQPVDFGFGFDLTTSRGQALLAAVRFLAGELDREGGITEVPLAREQLEAYVMTQLLLAARNPYTDLLSGAVDRVQASRLRPVLDHMKAHADQPLTPGELARVGCMSVRTLHATFRHELGVSPMAHLRPDPAGPRARRAASVAERGRTDRRRRHALGLLPPQPLRPAVPGAVRRAALGYRRRSRERGCGDDRRRPHLTGLSGTGPPASDGRGPDGHAVPPG